MHLNDQGGGSRRMADGIHRVSNLNSLRPHHWQFPSTKCRRCRRSTGPTPLPTTSKE